MLTSNLLTHSRRLKFKLEKKAAWWLCLHRCCLDEAYVRHGCSVPLLPPPRFPRWSQIETLASVLTLARYRSTQGSSSWGECAGCRGSGLCHSYIGPGCCHATIQGFAAEPDPSSLVHSSTPNPAETFYVCMSTSLFSSFQHTLTTAICIHWLVLPSCSCRRLWASLLIGYWPVVARALKRSMREEM